VGLGRPAVAAALLQRVAAQRPRSQRLQQQFMLALERAHRFAAEARDARRAIGLPGAPEPGRAVYPAVSGPAGGHYADVVGLLSLGAGRLAPLSVHLFPLLAIVAPSASVIDTSFIPAFRDAPGVTDDAQGCPDLAYRRALVLAGSPASALIGYPAEFSCEESDSLKAIALLELGERRGAVDDLRQNLWRWAGDLPRAERAAGEWVAATHHAPEAVLRAGEIEFLRGRFDDAAADFGDAARRARDRFATWTRIEAEATLDRGAALARAGRRAEAMTALRAADDIASRSRGRGRGVTIQILPADAISGHARLQLADAEREAGALRAAAEDYAGARYHGLPAATTGALENNAAIVDIALGRHAQAERATHQARAVDPESPAYLMTAAYAAARAGRIDTAIRRYGATLRADPTTFGAANDLGVLYARRGDTQRAVAVLRRAVGADEHYALGWFNLGVVLGGMGPRQLFASQGALARAFALDPALRDRERVPTLDARTYRTGLDVSRPLPAEWTFASSQRHAPAKTAGFAALLLVAFTLSRTLSATGSGRGLAEKWLSPLSRASGRFLGRLRHPAIAIGATLAVFAWPLVRSPGGGVSAAVAGVLGLVVLLALALRVRARAAGRQETWAPGVVFGLGTAAAGLTWAPLPVLKGDASARLHWAAPVALGSVALPLVLLSVWTDIPLARSLAAAALVMAASLLTPVKPVDGGAIAEAGGTAAGLTAVGLAVVLALGLV
jgi:tetratricopeptide (TPR) repeat protein